MKVKKREDIQCAGLGEVDERNPHIFEEADRYCRSEYIEQ